MVTCAVFGMPEEMSQTGLPTYENVIKYVLLVKHKLKPTISTKEPTITDISQKVAEDVERLWIKASIPVISHTRVVKMIRSYYDKFIKVKKNKKRSDYAAKADSFRRDAKNRLFDIAACKCLSGACNCDKSRKVPHVEQDFLHDQRSVRLMIMSNIDKRETKKLCTKQQRKCQESMRAKKLPMSVIGDGDATLTISSSDESDDNIPLSQYRNRSTGMPTMADNADTDDNGELLDIMQQAALSTSVDSASRNIYKFPALARACDRHGLSDRSAAAIATAVLEDIGVVTAVDSSNVIDRSKIRRERKRKRSQLQHTQESKTVRGIYFDGRKDKTLVNRKESRKYYRRTVIEEHISIIRLELVISQSYFTSWIVSEGNSSIYCRLHRYY